MKYIGLDTKNLSYDYDGGDPVIHDYLQMKIEMPECPKCNNNLQVMKKGWRNSSSKGRRKRYFCRPCNYYFTLSSRERIDTE
jgi:transposase-like protein